MATEDGLYELPLDEFTAARQALAKELTRSGDREAAARVKGLRKPNKTAWALNQLARRRPEQVEALLAAGEQLREAQERALAGDARGLRSATRAEQEQVSALVDQAVQLLGGSATMEDRLRRTLRAAATDPQTGELLRRGRLVTDVDSSGFGIDDLAAPLERTLDAITDAEADAKTEADTRAEAFRARRVAEEEAGRLRTEADRADARERQRRR